MWLRSAHGYSLQKQLPQIGTRQRKAFCWVAGGVGNGGGGIFGWLLGSSKRSVLSVSVCERTVGLHERHHLERALAAQHALLLPVLHVEFPRPDRAVIVREWQVGGSLRDVLHSARPEDDQNDKYDRVGTPLSEAKIAKFGRALIDVLLVLRPLGARVAMHLHLGNVFLVEGTQQLRAAEWCVPPPPPRAHRP